jgi:hypothetical protein
MLELSKSNFKDVYDSHQIPLAVGRSFLFSAFGAAIINGGNVLAALSTGSMFAVITFSASVLSPLIAGVCGESTQVAAGRYKACLVDLAILIATCVVTQLVFNVTISPVLLGVGVLAPLVLTSSSERLVGKAMSIMSVPGLLAAFAWSIIENNY